MLGSVYYVADVVTGGFIEYRFEIYVETNGREGLQTGGLDLLGRPTMCAASDNPDTLLLAEYR